MLNAELFKELFFDVHATGAVRIRDRPGLEQRIFQLAVGADSGLGSALLHDHSDTRIGQLDTRCGVYLALLDQVVQRIADHDHDVGTLATGQTIGNRLRRFAHRRAKNGVQ
ncbi:hypothetical protein A245_23586 [Pseudomonas syringae pv. actinidiae ICMP 19096]|uniref:Uncharacterized protein n=1 Tax=Pseudomonas syringae pv. actinidiae ICMP 19096 TaxID=1194405 RepID=A0A656JUI8_PSESF|nr:hypothetical protein A245_23586 [Pseudomonas syringae pv. actinidiae ICMP 19096]